MKPMRERLMGMRQRKEYTPEYKAKIVLELLKEETTVNAVAAREEISVKQLYNWRKEFLDGAPRVFARSQTERDAERTAREFEAKESEYQAKIGALTIENDWLKKKSAQVLGAGWETKFGFKGR